MCVYLRLATHNKARHVPAGYAAALLGLAAEQLARAGGIVCTRNIGPEFEMVDAASERVNGQVAYILVAASLNAGFAFYEARILYDVAIILVLAAGLYLRISRVCAVLLLCFGLFAFYRQLEGSSNPFELRAVVFAWLIYLGAISSYLAFRYHRVTVNSECM